MGCAASGLNKTMSLFGKRSQDSHDIRIKEIERKLYLAKESPDPEFDISDCQLRQLPTGIFSICKVFRKDYLYLQNNCLSSLEEGGQLLDLHLVKILNISFNSFKQLPNHIKYLTSLTELYLQNNFLESLPKVIGHLQSLKILNISNNRLKILNSEVGKLKYLSKLNVSKNENLHELCPELCYANNITCIELDVETILFPSYEITSQGTEAIKQFLCKHMNVEYIEPVLSTPDTLPVQTSSRSGAFQNQLKYTWEEQEAVSKEQEEKIHRYNQQQREKFLTKVLLSQQSLDKEIAKAHETREQERQRLFKCIQDDENLIKCLLKNFIQSDRLQPEVIQQQLAYEQAEHDHLLEITRKNYDNIRRADILKATEQLMEKDNLIQYYKKHYVDNLNNMKKDILLKETEGATKLANILYIKNENRSGMIQQLLEDQELQQAAVASLLDRVDAKSWSLNQEISLVSTHLAKLSIIEQEKKKVQLEYNYNDLLQQRVELVNLLDDLFKQRHKRRQQLLDTLKEAECETPSKTDFWLRSYQKLLDSAPKSLFDIGKLDPMFANYLIQESVIHCLPFLVKFIFSGKPLTNITDADLKQNGVTLSSDRKSILQAISQYVDSKSLQEQGNEMPSPNAPSLAINHNNYSGVLNEKEQEESTERAECVICMDSSPETVFVPCGHMCCCQPCLENELENCPMCRTKIERTIKVLLVL